jgi:hypothetical protein
VGPFCEAFALTRYVDPMGTRLQAFLRVTAVYICLLGAGIGTGVMADSFGLDPYRSMSGYAAVLFFLAALGWPKWLADTVRGVGWFALVESKATVRVILLVLAAIAVAGVLGGAAVSPQPP